MKLIAVLFCVIAAALAAPQPLSPIKPAPVRKITSRSRILNGESAELHQFPWAAAIYINNAYFCEGALISDQWIVSAGHCIQIASQLRILLGSSDITGGDKALFQSSSREFLVHDDFDAPTLTNDIALARLATPVVLTDFVQVIPVSYREVGEGTSVTVSGWGQEGDDESLPISNTLKYVALTTLSNQVCQIYYGATYVHEDTLCAEYSGNTIQNACEGDSGSPLVDQSSLIPTLVGIFSFYSGLGCESGYPSGFTRIGIYADWITSTTAHD